jgi:DNA-binding IclR family transcriptional regulator
VKTIATICGAQEQLLLRLLRTLAGMGFVRQTGKEDFAATPVSIHMTKASVRAGVRYL